MTTSASDSGGVSFLALKMREEGFYRRLMAAGSSLPRVAGSADTNPGAPVTCRTRVFIAGPYSKPYCVHNVHNTCLVWKQLWDLGYAPLAPHWTFLQDLLTPMPYEQWLAYDKEMLPTCHALLRLPGASSGADAEAELARALGMPVYESVDALLTGLPCTWQAGERYTIGND